MIRKRGFREILAALVMMVFLLMPMQGKALGAALAIDDRSGVLGDAVVFTMSVNSAPNAVDSLGADIGLAPIFPVPCWRVGASNRSAPLRPGSCALADLRSVIPLLRAPAGVWSRLRST